jgi:hypothetical protein
MHDYVYKILVKMYKTIMWSSVCLVLWWEKLILNELIVTKTKLKVNDLYLDIYKSELNKINLNV